MSLFDDNRHHRTTTERSNLPRKAVGAMEEEGPLFFPGFHSEELRAYATNVEQQDSFIKKDNIIKAARNASGRYLAECFDADVRACNDRVTEVQMQAAMHYVAKQKYFTQERQAMSDYLVSLRIARQDAEAALDKMGGFNAFIANKDLTDLMMYYQGTPSPWAAVVAVDKNGIPKDNSDIPGDKRGRLEHQQIWSVNKAAVAAYERYKEYHRWPENGTRFWRSPVTHKILGIWTPLTHTEHATGLGYFMANEKAWRKLKTPSLNRLGPHPPGDSFQTEFANSASTQARRDGGALQAGVEYTTTLGVTEMRRLQTMDCDGLRHAVASLCEFEILNATIVTEHVNYVKPASRTEEHKQMMEGLEPMWARLEPTQSLWEAGDSSVSWGFQHANKVSLTKRDYCDDKYVVMKHVDSGNGYNNRKQPEGSVILQFFREKPLPTHPPSGIAIDEWVQDAEGRWQVYKHQINESGMLESYPIYFIHYSTGSLNVMSFSWSLYKDAKTERSAQMMAQLNISNEHKQQLIELVHMDSPYRFDGIPGFLTAKKGSSSGKDLYDKLRDELKKCLAEIQQAIRDGQAACKEARTEHGLRVAQAARAYAQSACEAHVHTPRAAPPAAKKSKTTPLRQPLFSAAASSSSSSHTMVMGRAVPLVMGQFVDDNNPADDAMEVRATPLDEEEESAAKSVAHLGGRICWVYTGGPPEGYPHLQALGPPGAGPYQIMGANNKAGFKNVFEQTKGNGQWTYSWERKGSPRVWPNNGKLYGTSWEAAWRLTAQLNFLYYKGEIPAPPPSKPSK